MPGQRLGREAADAQISTFLRGVRWPWERRRVAGPPRWARVFAPDLLVGTDDLLARYSVDDLTLPISIPIGPDGLVLLQPGGPLDAPRVPAALAMRIVGPDHVTLAIERSDGEAMRIPGIASTAPLRTIVADVTTGGLHLTSPDGELLFDDDTAMAYATALLITLRMKVTKARRPDPPSPWHELVQPPQPEADIPPEPEDDPGE